MKRFATIIIALALTLFLPSCAFAGNTEVIEIVPTFLPAIDYTVTQWYTDDDSRTILATCALLDLYLSDNDQVHSIVTESLGRNSIYVGKNSLTLYGFFFGNEKMVLLIFTPFNENAEVITSPLSYQRAEECLELALKENLLTVYHQIDSEDILFTFSEISGK